MRNKKIDALDQARPISGLSLCGVRRAPISRSGSYKWSLVPELIVAAIVNESGDYTADDALMALSSHRIGDLLQVVYRRDCLAGSAASANARVAQAVPAVDMN